MPSVTVQLLRTFFVCNIFRTSINREVSITRNKLAQLQADYDIVKRQLTTERFERERAIQEMRRHGLSTTSRRASSPLSSTFKTSHSPERTVTVVTEQADKYVIE
nr:centrosomal protein of 135 kDa-like [Zootoca vivipara]